MSTIGIRAGRWRFPVVRELLGDEAEAVEEGEQGADVESTPAGESR